MKILIVDDEQLDLFISKKLLGLQHEVEGFQTLPEAVEWAKNNSFDILLSDYYLATGVHAPDVLQAIVALKGKNFKAFVLSNHVDDKQTAQLKSAGFDGIIDKPLSIDKFTSALNGL